MPYFKWSGINIYGNIIKGKQCAPSPEILDTILFKQNIALLNAQSIYAVSSKFLISSPTIINIYQQLTLFVEAGILLPHAVSLVAQQTSNVILQEMLMRIWQDLEQGKTLSAAGKKHPIIMPPMISNLLAIGEESGNLLRALHVIVSYLENKHLFIKRMRSALIMPFITVSFLLLITSFIVFLIIPQFQTIFASLGKQLPSSTQTMLHISLYAHRYAKRTILGIISIGIVIGIISHFNKNIRLIIAQCILLMPLGGKLITYRTQINWLASVSMMIEGGMSLITALHLAPLGIKNPILQEQYQKIARATEGGHSLADSMRYETPQLFSADVLALVSTGQETGALSTMLTCGVTIVNEKINQLLTLISIVTQPILLIIIGMMVLGLIIAIYEPIMVMSQAIG